MPPPRSRANRPMVMSTTTMRRTITTTAMSTTMSEHPTCHHASHPAAMPASPDAGADIAIDPICGMKVVRATAKHTAIHGGATQYFCSARCRERFLADPDSFGRHGDAGCHAHRKQATTSAPASADIIHTCPMHPEVRQKGPGFCPICGMALEPEEVAADAGPNPERIDMQRRFWIGLALTA